MITAPAVHTLPKSRFYPSRLREHIIQSVMHQRGMDQAQAVLVDGRAVALVKGNAWDDRVRVKEVTHEWWMSQTGYDGLNNAAKSGQFVDIDYLKTCTSWNKNNIWGDLWPCAGTPEAGDYSGTNAARQFSNSSLGAAKGLNLRAPVSNTRNLEGYKLSTPGAGTACVWFLQLCDRVVSWDGSSITTTAQTMTNTLAAQRYISSGDPGLRLTPTIQSNIAALTTPVLSSCIVTDNLGNASVTTPTIYSRGIYNNGNAGTTTAPAPVFCPHDNTNVATISPWIQMPAGVTGIRKLESVTYSAAQVGTVSWVGWFPIATVWANYGMANLVDFARGFFQLPRIYDTACLSMFGIEAGGAANTLMGSIQVVH